MDRKVERTGTIGYNKNGSAMTIVEYYGTRDILVKFEKGKPVHTTWQYFLKGNVRNPYDKTIFGVGCFGEGKYLARENGKTTIQYSTWYNMIKRAYSHEYQKKYSTYIGCSVTEEWHNFQTFSEWFDENYYEIEGQKMALDKDILFKGNKIYSPATSVFVSERINNLFIKKDKNRGKFPIGVYWHKGKQKYYARCCNKNSKQISLGYHDTPEGAFFTYKSFKEKLIKQIAEEYKNKIPAKLYNAMYKYEVKITD